MSFNIMFLRFFDSLCIYHKNEKSKSLKNGFALIEKQYHTFFLGIPISGTRGCLFHITVRPRARAGKIKKESGKEFHFPFMLGNL